MIRREDRDGITVLFLEHGKANALDTELSRELLRSLDEAERSSARALVLTATGSIFSAGVDLKRVLEGGRAYLEDFVPALSEVVLRLFGFPMPVVAGINGHAIAGGCILAAACDYRVMTDGAATIGLPEQRIGLAFPPAALEVMRFHLGDRAMQQLIHTGGKVGPEEAVSIRLVEERAAPDSVLDRALEVAIDWSEVPSRTFALSKRQIRYHAIERIRRSESEFGAEVGALWTDPATLDEIRKFVEKTLG